MPAVEGENELRKLSPLQGLAFTFISCSEFSKWGKELVSYCFLVLGTHEQRFCLIRVITLFPNSLLQQQCKSFVKTQYTIWTFTDRKLS